MELHELVLEMKQLERHLTLRLWSPREDADQSG